MLRNILASGHVGTLLWPILAVVGAVGLLAIVSPKSFSVVASRGNRWIDTQKILAQLDRPIDVDRYVLPYSRYLGLAVILSVVVLGFVAMRYF